ncbi:unnamed protein product [Oikopleura dioica]|uniref:Uncharacterized protein n=1 Tax=Oikopleura dioica TaxID=34765 RepID=E4XGY4_OIKDI|nr:unnamed protein product [Oikopleura dioica]
MEDHRRSTSPISVDFVQNAQPLPYGNCQQEDFDADDLHKPCVSTCCLCCNLGLGSILTGVGFVNKCTFSLESTGQQKAAMARKMIWKQGTAKVI